MTYKEQQPELDSAMIIPGLGYASSLLVVVDWVAPLAPDSSRFSASASATARHRPELTRFSYRRLDFSYI